MATKTNEVSEKILMNQDEAAAFIGVSRPTLRRWTRDAGVPYVMVGKRVRYYRAALLDWLNNSAMATASCP